MGAAPAFFGTAADGGAGTPNSGDVAGRFLQRDSEACYASDAGSGRGGSGRKFSARWPVERARIQLLDSVRNITKEVLGN